MGAVGGLGYVTYRHFRPKQIVNPCINKSSDKVVSSVDIEDLTGEKTCYCRCWRSKKVVTEILLKNATLFPNKAKSTFGSDFELKHSSQII